MESDLVLYGVCIIRLNTPYKVVTYIIESTLFGMVQNLQSHVDIPVEPHGDMERWKPVVLHLSVRLTPNPFRSD